MKTSVLGSRTPRRPGTSTIFPKRSLARASLPEAAGGLSRVHQRKVFRNRQWNFPWTRGQLRVRSLPRSVRPCSSGSRVPTERDAAGLRACRASHAQSGRAGVSSVRAPDPRGPPARAHGAARLINPMRTGRPHVKACSSIPRRGAIPAAWPRDSRADATRAITTLNGAPEERGQRPDANTDAWRRPSSAGRIARTRNGAALSERLRLFTT